MKTQKCRRRVLLEYFDKKAKSELFKLPSCCDNCRSVADGVTIRPDTQDSNDAMAKVGDFSKYAAVVFGAISDLR